MPIEPPAPTCQKSPAVLAIRYTPNTGKDGPAARITVFIWHCNPMATINHKPRKGPLSR